MVSLTVGLVTVVSVLITIWMWNSSRPKRPIIDAPFPNLSKRQQKKKWRWDTANFLSEFCLKFPGRVFQVWTSDGPEIIIPETHIDELRRLPDNVLSASKGASEVFEARITTVPIEEDQVGHYGPEFIQAMINKNLPKYVLHIKEGAEQSIPVQFQSYPDWTPVRIHKRMVNIVGRIVTRIFVGPKFSTNETWLKIITNYPIDIFVAALLLKLWPTWLRSFGSYFIPQMWRIWRYNATAKMIVMKTLEEDAETEDNEIESSIQRAHSMLPDTLKDDYEFQGRGQLGLALASVHNTSRMLTNAIYNLAAYPEHIISLRKEIDNLSQLLPGPMTIETVSQMSMMDSFLKETIRRGGGIITFRRKVLQPYTMSDGTQLLPGTYISVPSLAISLDPNNMEAPDKFDGFRFHKQRSLMATEEGQKLQLASIDPQNMYFGAGKHACTGRFLAAIMVKLILVEFLSKYDFKLKAGQSRPEEFIFEGLRINRKDPEILVRNRSPDTNN